MAGAIIAPTGPLSSADLLDQAEKCIAARSGSIYGSSPGTLAMFVLARARQHGHTCTVMLQADAEYRDPVPGRRQRVLQADEGLFRRRRCPGSGRYDFWPRAKDGGGAGMVVVGDASTPRRGPARWQRAPLGQFDGLDPCRAEVGDLELGPARGQSGLMGEVRFR